MARPVIFAANASPEVGGQGLNLTHVVDAVTHDGRESVIACRAPFAGKQTVLIQPTAIDRYVPRIPVVRRLKDWMTLISDVSFDARVAASLNKLRARFHRSPIFHGAVGQSALSMRWAKKNGVATLLDVVNTHIADIALHVERECRTFGTRGFIHPEMKSRILAEYDRADAIRVMSERARRTFELAGFDTRRVFVATPPVEPSAFDVIPAETEVFRVAFVGLLEPWKGFQYLVDGFQKLTERDAELVLWGGPSSRPVSRFLDERCARDPRIRVRPDSVRAVGFQEVYGAASVLVHPSLTDGFGYVVAEAMASGIPVIVGENCGAADLVRDGSNGFIVPGGSSTAIFERLEYLLKNPSQRRSMGAAARETVKGLTPQRFAAAYEPILRRLEMN